MPTSRWRVSEFIVQASQPQRTVERFGRQSRPDLHLHAALRLDIKIIVAIHTFIVGNGQAYGTGKLVRRNHHFISTFNGMDFSLQIHLRIIHILLLAQTVVVMVHPARFVRIVYADIYRSSICPPATWQAVRKNRHGCHYRRCRQTCPSDEPRFRRTGRPGAAAGRKYSPSGRTLHILSNHPLHYRRNQDVIIGLADIIVLRLPASVIVTARPGSYGPTVVVLPEKRPHIIRHLAAVRLDGRLDGISCSTWFI